MPPDYDNPHTTSLPANGSLAGFYTDPATLIRGGVVEGFQDDPMPNTVCGHGPPVPGLRYVKPGTLLAYRNSGVRPFKRTKGKNHDHR